MNNAANAKKRENPARPPCNTGSTEPDGPPHRHGAPTLQQPPCNIVVAGLGGQGVLTATDIIADVALRAGYDVKKSEIKGMSQRGGSVACDVRFGAEILSPMVPAGEADFLLALEAAQLEPNRHLLRPGGVTIEPSAIDAARLAQKKMLNVALLGALSARLPMAEDAWLESVRSAFDAKYFEANRQAFLLGRASQGAAIITPAPGADATPEKSRPRQDKAAKTP